MLNIRASGPQDGERVVTIWRDAVDATHDFLLPGDREAIDLLVQDFLPKTPLWLAVDENDRAVGFMGLAGAHMEALFIDPAYRGIGVGRMLVEYALRLHRVLSTDVNEQNGQAVGFYRHLGFVPIGRSATDGEGRPYPLIHMRLEKSPQNAL